MQTPASPEMAQEAARLMFEIGLAIGYLSHPVSLRELDVDRRTRRSALESKLTTLEVLLQGLRAWITLECPPKLIDPPLATRRRGSKSPRR